MLMAHGGHRVMPYDHWDMQDIMTKIPKSFFYEEFSDL